jgi:hypothetical protein
MDFQPAMRGGGGGLSPLLFGLSLRCRRVRILDLEPMSYAAGLVQRAELL